MEQKRAKFFETAKYFEQLKEKYVEVREELEKLMLELGIDTYHQDPETLAVYKIHKPSGQFVFFKDVDYKRTALVDEKASSSNLAKKEAEEKGFALRKS